MTGLNMQHVLLTFINQFMKLINGKFTYTYTSLGFPDFPWNFLKIADCFSFCLPGVKDVREFGAAVSPAITNI